MPVLDAIRPVGEIGCAWHKRYCGADLVYDGQTGRPLPDFPYAQVRSHGICDDCLQALAIESDAARPSRNYN